MRRSYDAVAEQYLDGFAAELGYKPLDRALLACLLEQSDQHAPIADLGCGPGHVAGWLASQGARAVGIDVSAGMIAAGRREYSQVEFRHGDLLALPAEDGEFGAAVALYSIIHLQPGELPGAFTEIHRVLRPGGLVLVAFHVGTEVRHVAQWWGREVDVDFWFFEPAHITDALERAGLRVEARLERCSYDQETRPAVRTCWPGARSERRERTRPPTWQHHGRARGAGHDLTPSIHADEPAGAKAAGAAARNTASPRTSRRQPICV